MATARYFPLASGAPSSTKPLNSRFVASLATGVAVLSGLTVFLALCERDHSLLASATGLESGNYLSQPAPVTQLDAQPAPDTVTRVTVPTTLDQVHPLVAKASRALPIQPPSQAKPSGATWDDSDAVIAKNHTELVALQKRGVRRYVEFTLAPSRRFRRVGPVSVDILRIDVRRKLYDVSVITDSHRIERRHVALYSPVRIGSSEYGKPLDLVVNAMNHRAISGYISEPKSTR